MRRAIPLGLLLFTAAAWGAEGVRWRAWDAEAFDAAQRAGKPILLFVAAEWSAASRRMEAEVFGNPELGAAINELFIPIRIEAGRRPDLAQRYNESVRALSGGAGWPLTLVLTPEGLPFFGGTAFTLDDDLVAKRPGLRSILLQTGAGWREDRAGLVRDAQALAETLRKASEPAPPREPAPPPSLDAALARMSEALDPVGGGFGPRAPGPKFPTPSVLELALLHYARTANEASLGVATRTLDGMLAGGIYDRVGGGFHRHALDRRWRVPRFEKLTEFNAEMVLLLVHAWQATGAARYREAAERSMGWLMDEMADPERGGWRASLAGDAEAYYTWTAGEFERAIDDPATRAVLGACWGVDDRGDLPLTEPFRNVLFEALPLKEAASAAGCSESEARKRLAEGLERLRAARAQRVPPAVDTALFVDANARAISASLEAAAAFDRPAWRAFALKSLERLLAEAVDEAQGAAHVLEGDGRKGFYFLARDEAALGVACLDAYAASGEMRYLDAARQSAARLRARFADPQGACCDRAFEAPGAPPPLGRLADRLRPFQDTPGPSANALAIFLELRLAALLGDAGAAYAASARKTLNVFEPDLEAIAGAGPALWRAADLEKLGTVMVFVEGPAEAEGARALRRAAGEAYLPNRETLVAPNPELRAVLGLGAPQAGEPPRAYVIVGGGAVLTAEEPKSLRRVLEQTRRR
ncbi:MAG: DUF255 domain-containing protein [Planctomycetota bacterium]|nr:DUF255 domain-containing protein [Planctomycetota bacterium]